LGNAIGLSNPALEELVTGFSRDRSVLVVDSFESLEPISGWVRDTLLPALPSQVAVILAGRLAPEVTADHRRIEHTKEHRQDIACEPH